MTEEQQSTTQEDSASTARDEAIALLEAEMAKAESGEETPAAETPAPKVEEKKVETPKEESPKEEQKEEGEKTAEENRIAVTLRARRQAQKIREDAESRAQQLQRELEDRERKLQDREQSVKSRLREKPIEALRELGIDPREFFERAVEDPKQLNPVEQTRAELEALKKQLADREAQERQRQAEERAAYEAAQRQQAQRAAVDSFLGEALSDKFPLLSAAYKEEPEELAEKAIKVVRQYAANGGDPSELTDTEIAAFLEDRERKKYTSLKGRFEQVGSEATQPAGGNVTITNKDAAQKRSRPSKTVEEMSVEERRRAAIAALGGG